uniref:Uncharacterized protein n=1 Tax=Rhizophora mucronata TaxID=61149 RepID=A0A2P2QHT4_RHIMU
MYGSQKILCLWKGDLGPTFLTSIKKNKIKEKNGNRI